MDQPGPPAAVVVAAVTVAVLLAAVAGLVGGVTQAGDDDTPLNATSEELSYLSPAPEEVTRETYTRTGIDVSAAAAADGQRLRGRHTAATFEQRFGGVENRSAFVEQVAARLETRALALDEHHAEVLEAYGEGEYTTGRLLGELVRMDAAAATHQRLRDRVETAVEAVDGFELNRTVQEQFVALDTEIPALESPVVDELAAAPFDRTTVYTQATETALVLATAGETHLRRVTLRGERDRNGPNRFVQGATDGQNANSLALKRAQSLYGERQVRGFFPPPLGATSVYGVQGDTAVGEFVGYIDGATRNRFHERRSIDAPGIPAVQTLSDTAGSVELSVETTTPTGPMQLSVTDEDNPVEGAALSVANTTVGTTDAAGERWVTQPLAGATVRATVGNETLQVTLPG